MYSKLDAQNNKKEKQQFFLYSNSSVFTSDIFVRSTKSIVTIIHFS